MKYIYLIKNLENNKKYIGQTKDIKRRKCEWCCLKVKYANKYLSEDREKYGLDKFTYELIEIVNDEYADDVERSNILKYNTLYPNGYNIATGGVKKFDYCEEMKNSISKNNKGLKRSDESKKKMSESHKGKKLTEEHKTKLSKSNSKFWLGKHRDERTKQKISKANKNGKTAKPLIQIKDNGEIIEWPSARECERSGFSYVAISNACNGKYLKEGNHKYKNSEWHYKIQ